MKVLNESVEGLKESIFSTITQLANAHQAINLSQGFPDFDGPSWLIEMAKSALDQGSSGKNQYAPSYGLVRLRETISANYEQFYKLKYDPAKEVVVTNGATEAIYCTIMALVNPGDEVIAFEPLYDSYLASVQLARGQLKTVTLKAPHFQFDLQDLKNQITAKTKLLILNNPNNPTGKVFTSQELTAITKLAAEHDFYILSDEVYEFLTFEQPHIPTALLADTKDRVITISSVGKTFSMTGWKIGWACGSPAVIRAIHNVHQFVCFCVAHPLQAAVAEALTRTREYLPDFRASYLQKRNLLVDGLTGLGLKVAKPQGTYFAMAQIPGQQTDMDFCKSLILNKKVATIPTSPFYVNSDEGKHHIRFCFAKKEETLQRALTNLRGGF